ncbi:MAG TPA: acylneuraminate cytidylyltransferase family protein [Phycisphaerae bacterium]|nr:acylneuraminate cytidylyltransferase family protein [Phycisphaerae bacterium]
MNETHETGNKKREVLAVIMARGGSVGLPGKALRPLLGRPVISFTFDHVRESTLMTRSVVSSDDAAILALASTDGFETLRRPVELATSTSATDPVLRHAVHTLYGTGCLPHAVVMLYGNVPVRRGRMIDRCIAMLLETGCDSVQTIAPVGKMHPYWMFDMDGEHRIKKHVPNNVFRRQNLPPLYSPTGAVYVIRTDILMAAANAADPHAFLGADRRGLVIAPEDSVDIDTEKDLWVAEAVLRGGKS